MNTEYNNNYLHAELKYHVSPVRRTGMRLVHIKLKT